MTFNLREICRLCLAKKESLAPLFSEQVSNTITSLPAKIMSFVPVLKVCWFCFKRNWLIFKYMLCIGSDGDVFCNMYIEYKFHSQLENSRVEVQILYIVFHGMYYNASFVCVSNARRDMNCKKVTACFILIIDDTPINYVLHITWYQTQHFAVDIV
jgi:hypothetical protein